jgi:dipeptidase E
MKLFLASEAKHPDSMEKLKNFVGGFEGKKIVYIPTAANGEAWGSWRDGGSIAAAKSLDADLEVIELENYYKIDVVDRIRKAEILWMAGGMAGYLLYWIRRVELDKVLPGILDSGTVYVGSSAGSMVCSKVQSLSEIYIGAKEHGAGFIPGLGLIDFEIYPHYEDELLPEIKKRWKKGKLYLLKNGEAITVENGSVKVLGEERIISK